MKSWTCSAKSPRGPMPARPGSANTAMLRLVGIEKGGRFLDFLSQGQHSMYGARKEGRAKYDLTDNEIEAVEQMAGMASAWRQSIDPDAGFLRFYVD